MDEKERKTEWFVVVDVKKRDYYSEDWMSAIPLKIGDVVELYWDKGSSCRTKDGWTLDKTHFQRIDSTERAIACLMKEIGYE